MNTITKPWRFDRRVSLSVLIQLVTLAALILGSWVNLQRQLDLVSRDVKQLLTTQEKFCDKLETLNEKTIAHEYRLRNVEQKRGKNLRPEGLEQR